jgi:hypothetical protein
MEATLLTGVGWHSTAASLEIFDIQSAGVASWRASRSTTEGVRHQAGTALSPSSRPLRGWALSKPNPTAAISAVICKIA